MRLENDCHIVICMTTFPIPSTPITATEFVSSVKGLTFSQRESKILDAFLAGHVPSWLRRFEPVQCSHVDQAGNKTTVIIDVTLDYLSIGTDDDWMYVPMTPLTAQAIADSVMCMLPTTKMVTDIFLASTRLPPQPWGPPYDASMQSTDRYVGHDKKVKATMAKMNISPGVLLGGHKKDVVMTNQLAGRPKQVAIFGWHQPSLKPIQPLYLGHENTYADYSHGIRLVSLTCYVDGQPTPMVVPATNAALCKTISNEVPLSVIRQPGVKK